MKRRLLALLFGLVAARPAFGCSCGERPDARSVLPRATAVVTGVVVGRHPVVIRGSEMRKSFGSDVPLLFPATRVDIAVTSIFKGDVREHLELIEIGCCVCEYGFEAGREYLIFAHPQWDMPNRLMATFCWPTKPIESAASDLRSLGAPLRTYSRRAEVRTLARRVLDRANVLSVAMVRRWPTLPTVLRERKCEIVWVTATAGLVLALLVVVVRAARARPRV